MRSMHRLSSPARSLHASTLIATVGCATPEPPSDIEREFTAQFVTSSTVWPSSTTGSTGRIAA
jgi:hypothetical protein